MGCRAWLRAALGRIDQQVDATPPTRNRAVDFFRVAAITVVVLWHWVLSVTQRQDGRLANPNPVEQIAGGEFLTWIFQVMPVFFIIGGYANLTGWDSLRRRGQGAGAFLRLRLSRLLLPALVFVAVWVVIDVVARLSAPDWEGVLTEAPILFTPLWFLGAYAWVTVLVPVTATLHRRFGVPVIVVLGAVVAGVDAGRFALDQEWLGLVNTALVWVFVHQLGYLWCDGLLEPIWRRWACALGGAATIGLATTLQAYPGSAVSVPSADISHMLPTTAVIAALAVAQLGVATLAAPFLSRWLRRRWPWRGVTLLSGVLLTVFLWHMTALLIVFLTAEALGFTPQAEPTPVWWAQRPAWLFAPAAVLVVLVAVFAPIERKIRGTLSISGKGGGEPAQR